MIRLIVRYFLNEQGMKYFTLWYNEVLAVISKQDGFRYIQYETENNLTTKIELHFENQEKLTQWTRTQLHQEISSKLKQHFLKPIETFKEEILNLEYSKIK